MKKVILIVSALVLILVLSIFIYGINHTKAIPEPLLSVKVADQEVKPIYYGNLHNKTREDLSRFLYHAFEEGWESIPYVALDNRVTIEFENFESDAVVITEALLTQEGTFLYNEKSDLTHEIIAENGTVTFELESNPATFLSSNSESYLPGHVIRAFFIKTEIYESNFVFAFVIRTNP